MSNMASYGNGVRSRRYLRKGRWGLDEGDLHHTTFRECAGKLVCGVYRVELLWNHSDLIRRFDGMRRTRIQEVQPLWLNSRKRS